MSCTALVSTSLKKGLDWKYCTGICTDGAAAMMRKLCSVVKQIQERVPEAKWTFLAQGKSCNKAAPKLHEVMNIAVKTVNYIKKNALNSRCFAALCERLDADHLQLFLNLEKKCTHFWKCNAPLLLSITLMVNFCKAGLLI